MGSCSCLHFVMCCFGVPLEKIWPRECNTGRERNISFKIYLRESEHGCVSGGEEERENPEQTPH